VISVDARFPSKAHPRLTEFSVDARRSFTQLSNKRLSLALLHNLDRAPRPHRIIISVEIHLKNPMWSKQASTLMLRLLTRASISHVDLMCLVALE